MPSSPPPNNPRDKRNRKRAVDKDNEEAKKLEKELEESKRKTAEARGENADMKSVLILRWEVINQYAEANRDISTCQDCHDRYDTVERQPTGLRCGDTSCRKCCYKNNGAYQCPTCNMRSTFPEEQPSRYNNFKILDHMG
uniref:RING-type domain-containing protein n=1 Tax=Caenorhabditis tropicalis TaxID=1561998 RepID=A0A1I7TRN7_9PELO